MFRFLKLVMLVFFFIISVWRQTGQWLVGLTLHFVVGCLLSCFFFLFYSLASSTVCVHVMHTCCLLCCRPSARDRLNQGHTQSSKGKSFLWSECLSAEPPSSAPSYLWLSSLWTFFVLFAQSTLWRLCPYCFLVFLSLLESFSSLTKPNCILHHC